jgi:hypothetical protein
MIIKLKKLERNDYLILEKLYYIMESRIQKKKNYYSVVKI